MKRSKGITLIALVITIIVVLILAGVGLNLTIGQNGIVSRTKATAEENRAGSVQEVSDMWKTDVIMAQTAGQREVSLEAILDQLQAQGLLQQNEVNIILDPSNENREIQIASKTINFKIDSQTQSETLAKQVQIGDYIAYQEGIGRQYESTADKNGSSLQVFSTKGNQYWRVLDITADQVSLISETPITTDAGNSYILNGKIGYINAVSELNQICSIYGYGAGAEYARSITREDIVKMTGATEEEIKQFAYDAFGDEYGKQVTYTSGSWPDGRIATTANPIVETLTYFSYAIPAGPNTADQDSIGSLLLCGKPGVVEYTYWLAHAGIREEINKTQLEFRIGDVANWHIMASPLYTTKGLESSDSNPIRPVVVLKKNMIKTTGNGTKESPYQIIEQ